MHLAAQYANQEVLRFLELDREPALASNGLRPYYDGLKALMRGNLDWSFSSGRYRDRAGLPKLRA
jgi:hypothetical protein